jgi:hypothetical protein
VASDQDPHPAMLSQHAAGWVRVRYVPHW